MFELKIIGNKQTWERFLLLNASLYTPFFQSWNWGNMQEKLGNQIYRYGFYQNDKLSGICLAVEIRAKRGHYLHLRHGPILTDFNSQFEKFISLIIKEAKRIKVDFIRMSPLVEEERADRANLTKLGLRNAPIHNMDAENAWILDLTETEDEILKKMRKTTRYLIRKAKDLPITIKETILDDDLRKFLILYGKTSKRHHFTPHRGIKEELGTFSKDGHAKLFLAYYKKKVIAGALVVFYGNQAVYHHAATDDDYKDIPASYLLQWQIIKRAKSGGFRFYNFWGVVPENKPNHPWQGLTLFKLGFGGERVNFVHAQDLPLSAGYWRTYFLEKIWKLRRGY